MADTIKEILHDKHQVSRRIIDALTEEDFERLRSAARDHENPYRPKAINMLVAANAAGTGALLAELLQDQKESADVRAAAARHLGRVGGVEAERPLLNALAEGAPPAIAIAVAAALTKSGGRDSIDPLGRLAETYEDAVRQQAMFARSAIAYREGIGGFELPVPRREDLLEVDPQRAFSCRMAPAPLREILGAFSSLGTDTYGVRLSRELAFSIECPPERMMLFLDARCGRDDFLRVASARPLLLGVIAARADEDASYSVRWLLFSWPCEGEQSLNLAVHRPSGSQVLFGTTDGRELELRSVRMPGAVPVEIRGRIEKSRLELSTALSERTRLGARTPTPIERPGK